MKKKVIIKKSKEKKDNNNKSVSSTLEVNNNKTKKIGIIALILIVISIISYFTLGLIPMIVLIVGISLILLLSKLLNTKGKKKKRKILSIIIITIISLAIIVCLGIVGFISYVIIQAPKFVENNLYYKESSIVYDINNNEYAKLGAQMRENITYDELPQVLIDAIIATEDSRFYQHNGFDAPRFIIASMKQAIGIDAGGASTISMQVIKNSFTDPTLANGFKGIVRKFTDIYLAVFKLEQNYTKEEILEFYANNYYLGANCYGVEQISQYYFGKSVKDLNLSEASIIAGLFQSPNSYNAYKYPENTTKRRETVLYLMEKHGYITKEEKELANAVPVTSLLVGVNANQNVYQGYIDTVVEELDKKYEVNPYVTPLLIYTNLDRSIQDGINNTINSNEHIYNNNLQVGIAAINPNNGQIVGIGARRDKVDAVNTLNYATGIKRQPGSTAKPLFDYGPGIEYNNWSTYTLFDDSPYHYSSGQEINNWDGSFMGTITLRTALSESRNIPALKAFQQVDNKKILSFVQSLGLTPEIDGGQIHEAHALGAFTGASPLVMAGAYAAFANGGYYYEPYSVNKIVYRENNDEIVHKSEKVQVMSDATAYMVTSVLKDVPIINGFGVWGINLAAKTGTTNYTAEVKANKGLPDDAIRDSWITGYTKDLAISMWYGFDETSSENYCPNLDCSISKNNFYQLLASNTFPKTGSDWEMPSSVVHIGIEKGSNPPLLPSANTPENEIIYEYFKKGTEPTEISDKYLRLEAPTELKINWNSIKKETVITWSKVNGNSTKYGKLGYNVYYENEKLDFVTTNSYTIKNVDNPDGTYKVTAVYKDNSSSQSEPATKIYQSNYFTYSSKFNDTNPDDTISLNSNYNIPDGKTIITVLENTKNVTNKVNISYVIKNIDKEEVTAIDTTKAGSYTITYYIKYLSYEDTLVKKVIIK